MSRTSIDPELLALSRESLAQTDPELLDMARSHMGMSDESAVGVVPAGFPGARQTIPVTQFTGPQQAETVLGDIGVGLSRGVGMAASQAGGAAEALGSVLPGAIGRRLTRAGQETVQMGEADAAQFPQTRTFAGSLAQSVPGMVGTIGASVMTGGVGGVLMGAGGGGALAAGQQYNDTKQRVLDAGGNIDQARTIAAREAGPVGLVSAVTGLVPVQRILGRISPQVANNVLSRLSSNRAARLIGDAAVEGSQEAAEELSSMIAQWAMEADPNAFDGGVARLRDAALGGAVLGPLAGGAVEYAASRLGGGNEGGTNEATARPAMGTPEDVALAAQGDAAQAVRAAGDTRQPGGVQPPDVADLQGSGRQVGAAPPAQTVAQDAVDSGSIADPSGRPAADVPSPDQSGVASSIAVLNDPGATDEQVQAALDAIAAEGRAQQEVPQATITGPDVQQGTAMPAEAGASPAPVIPETPFTQPATVDYNLEQANADAERAANLRFLSDVARATGQSPERYVTGNEPVSVPDALPERSFDVSQPRATPVVLAEPTTPEGWKARARELGLNDKGLWQVVRKRVREADRGTPGSTPRGTPQNDAIVSRGTRGRRGTRPSERTPDSTVVQSSPQVGVQGTTVESPSRVDTLGNQSRTLSGPGGSGDASQGSVGRQPWEMTKAEREHWYANIHYPEMMGKPFPWSKWSKKSLAMNAKGAALTAKRRYDYDARMSKPYDPEWRVNEARDLLKGSLDLPKSAIDVESVAKYAVAVLRLSANDPDSVRIHYSSGSSIYLYADGTKYRVSDHRNQTKDQALTERGLGNIPEERNIVVSGGKVYGWDDFVGETGIDESALTPKPQPPSVVSERDSRRAGVADATAAGGVGVSDPTSGPDGKYTPISDPRRRGAAINPIEEVTDMVRRAMATRAKTQAQHARDVARLEKRGAASLQSALDKSVKASERLQAALADTEAKRDAYRSVLQQSRTDLQNARTTIRDMGVRIAKKDAKIDKAKAADDARRVVADIAAKVPLRVRGKLTVAVRDAATLSDVYAAAGKASEIIALDLGRNASRAIDLYTGGNVTKRMSETARKRLQEIRTLPDDAERRFRAPLASSGEAAVELAALADEAKAIIHQHRIENKLIRLGRFLDADAERYAVQENVKGMKHLRPTEDGKGLQQPGWIKAAWRGNLNAGTLAMMLDGNKPNGPVQRLFTDIKKARGKRFEIVEAATYGADAAASKAGFDSLAHMMAVTSGALGDGPTITKNVTLGGKEYTLTLGELAKLYSTEQDASTRALIAAGKPIQFRAGGSFTDPITITAGDFATVRANIPSEIADAIDAMKVVRDRMFPSVQKTIRILKGYEPPKETGYEPRTINRELAGHAADAELQPDLSGAIDKHIENAGFTIERVNDKTTPLIIGDFFEDWVRSVGGQADVIALATPIANARTVLMHPETKKAVAGVFGDKMVERLRSVLVDAAGLRAKPGSATSVIQLLTRNVSHARTSLRMQSWLIQGSGVPRLWAEMDSQAFWAGVRGAFSDGVGKRMLEGSPMLRSRYAQTMAAVNTSLGDPSAAIAMHQHTTLRDALTKAGQGARAFGQDIKGGDIKGAFSKALPEVMDTIRVSNFFDSIPARIAWAGYEWQAKRLGHDEAWVRDQTEKALDKVLNSSDPMHISGYSSAMRNTALVPFTAFTSDQTSALNQVVQGFGESRAKGMKTLYAIALGAVWSSAVTGVGGYIAGSLLAGLGDDDEEKQASRVHDALVKASKRFLQETLGNEFATGKVLDVIDDLSNFRGVNVADSPMVGAANQTMRGLGGMAVAAYNATGDDKKADDAAEKFIDSILQAAEGVSALAGNPLAPHIGTLRKAIKAAND